MFKSARIKLTMWYLLIIMCITVAFSTVVYTGTVKTTEKAMVDFERGMEQRFEGATPSFERFQVSPRTQTLNKIKTRTFTLLVIINVILLFISGTISYFLAGITLAPIEEMVEKQKKFIADAAHELKTPLTAMKAQLEVGLKYDRFGSSTGGNVVKSVIEDIDTLTSLTNNLLRASKYQTYDNKNSMEEFNLGDLLNKVVEGMKEKANTNNITILVNNTAKDSTLRADKSTIKELLTILIDNAIKFNKKKGTVTLNIKRSNQDIILEIEDTGMGISKKELPFIFDRFYKADTARTRKEAEGFGLGLSIAKEIVDLHRGTIDVKSTVDKGTKFIVKLPSNL